MLHPLDPPRAVAVADALVPAVRAGVLSTADLTEALAVAVRTHAPDHAYPRAVVCRLIWRIRDAVAAVDTDEARARNSIRFAVTPLCQERRDGHAILAAAHRANRGVIPEPEVIDMCRAIAAATLRGTRHVR